MLPSLHRLTANDISEIMVKGRVIHTPLFTVKWLPIEGHSRLAALVPTKIVKTAVGRNKHRRMIYASIKKIYNHVISGQRIVVMLKVAAMNQPQEKIDEAVKEIFIKAKLII